MSENKPNLPARAKIQAQLPADMREELAAEALAMKERIGAPSMDFIGIDRNKAFKLPGSDRTGEELNVVIVDFVSMMQYYEGKYDPKNIKPPVCMSLGTEPKLLKPFDNSPKKQHADCRTCPKNQWGSDGKGKACKEQRVLAVMQPDDPKGPILRLKVSPTGVKYFDNFITKIAAQSVDLPHPLAVLTRIYFDAASDYPSLRFEIMGMNPDVAGFAARRKEARTLLLAPPDFGGAEPTTPVQKAA